MSTFRWLPSICIWLSYLNVITLKATPHDALHIINKYSHKSLDCSQYQIKQQSFTSNPNQQFTIEIVSGQSDWYHIRCESNNQCLESVPDSWAEDIEWLERASCDSNKKGQRFKFVAVGQNAYAILVPTVNPDNIDEHGDGYRYLDVTDKSIEDGARIQGYDCLSGYWNQYWIITWSFKEFENGDYYIIGINSDMSLECGSEYIQQNPFDGANNQKFHLSDISNTQYYTISCVNNNKCWDIYRVNDYPIKYRSCSSDLADQRWHFVDLGNEEYNIHVLRDNRILDVPGGSKSGGQYLIGWDDKHFGWNQIFKVMPTEVKDGYYYIENIFSKNMFGIKCNVWHYHRAEMYLVDHHTDQLVYIKHRGNNKYSIKCESGDEYFTMTKASTHGKVGTSSWTGDKNQLFKFHFSKIHNDEVYKIESVESGLMLEISDLFAWWYFSETIVLNHQPGQAHDSTADEQKWKLVPYSYDEFFSSDSMHHDDLEWCPLSMHEVSPPFKDNSYVEIVISKSAALIGSLVVMLLILNLVLYCRRYLIFARKTRKMRIVSDSDEN